MTIPLCCKEARRLDSQANANIPISSYLIAREIDAGGRNLVDWVVCYADQFPIVIHQFMEIFRCDRSNQANSLKKTRVQNTNLGLIAGNWQYAFNEVFHVHS